MNPKIDELIQKITSLENDLRDEVEKEQKKVAYQFKKGRVVFDKDVLAKQREGFISLLTYLRKTPILFIVTSPFIYGLIIPALILDMCVSIYQAINFRVYKIPMVKRDKYIVFDRQYLAYLNIIEKINCLYCSYFNGLMAYVSEIASKTEQYWCPIKHAKKIAYKHRYYDLFLPYGDASDYHQRLEELRKRLEKEEF